MANLLHHVTYTQKFNTENDTHDIHILCTHLHKTVFQANYLHLGEIDV